MKAFYFDVESELAHFRDHLSHAFLNTFLAPPPHTIIGFLGCCCGFTEKQTEEILSSNVIVGCRIVSVKGYVKDLVIMENQKVIPAIPFPRTRKLLVSPVYRIFIAANNKNKDKKDSDEKNDELISDLRHAVFYPKHTPFLGISDCLAYVRYISEVIDIEPTRFKETESVVSFPVSDTRIQKNDKRQKGHKQHDYQDIYKGVQEYSTRIKASGVLTVYPHVITVPRSYEITEKGRKPKLLIKLLISLNCVVSFKKPIDGWVVNGENVVLA
jgi:CRISPR-associated protein Cas5 subtype I-B